MNNYEYIIASLPVQGKDAGVADADAVLAEIRSQCSKSDNALIDKLTDSFNPDCLTEDFYKSAWSSRNGFLRYYLIFDLKVRNAKVRYLNTRLGRPVSQDLMPLPEDAPEEFDEEVSVNAILERDDILEREKGLDDIMWEKADELVQSHIFDIDIILSFIAKLKIAERWSKLDPESGRELFRRLVQEIRNTR